jgi:hypothetical protein
VYATLGQAPQCPYSIIHVQTHVAQHRPLIHAPMLHTAYGSCYPSHCHFLHHRQDDNALGTQRRSPEHVYLQHREPSNRSPRLFLRLQNKKSVFAQVPKAPTQYGTSTPAHTRTHVTRRQPLPRPPSIPLTMIPIIRHTMPTCIIDTFPGTQAKPAKPRDNMLGCVPPSRAVSKLAPGFKG